MPSTENGGFILDDSELDPYHIESEDTDKPQNKENI